MLASVARKVSPPYHAQRCRVLCLCLALRGASVNDVECVGIVRSDLDVVKVHCNFS
jgi:hypothetical protein